MCLASPAVQAVTDRWGGPPSAGAVACRPTSAARTALVLPDATNLAPFQVKRTQSA